MNATEDGEPLGEAPEYVIITAPPREGLTSIPVLGENERQAIAEIGALHRKRTGRAIGFGDMPDEDYCPECSTPGVHVLWPCRTAQTLEKRGL